LSGIASSPEVRKAGGVYYTPKYIVDYIVEQTVGALVEGRTNESSLRGSEATKQSHATDEEIAALPSVARNDRNKKNKMMTPAQVSKLRILDPACGSGSFLIGAFERLQKYYIDYYTANPKKNKGYLREDYEGNPKLDILVKKKILEEHIYGVDIDPQAVDITEFSLYVKMLEGEENLPMFAETYLPKLKNNIKCGNSLIGWDILDMDILPTDPDERQAELERINPFDWEREFPEVLSPHPIADQSPHPKSFSQGEKDLGPPSPFGRGTEGEDSSARGTECESPHPESFSQGESPHPESFSQGEKDLGPPSPFGRGTEGEGTYRYSPKYIIELARELRKKSNKPEELMWYLLRDRRFHGLKFRRQHPIDRYIADFYCHELKLVIELDGLVHEGEYQKEYDENRNEYMIASGYNVLRIDADEVMNDCENVLKRIEDEVMALSPHPIADQSPHPKSFSQGEKDLGPPSPFGRGTEGEGSSTGFDAVIGNPPWISITGRFRNEVFLDGEIQYMIDRFKGNTYMPNIYEYFVSQGFNITKQDGYFSFIVPDRLAYNRQFVQLRSKLLEHSSIQVILFRPVFPGITADTMIFSLKKGKPKKNHEIEVSEFGKESVSIYQSRYKENEGSQWNYFENRKIISLIDRIEKDKQIVRLNELIRTTSGFGGKSQKITENKISPKQIPVIKGDCIGRYVLLKNYFFEFIRDNITGRTTDRNKLGAKPKVLLRKTGNCIIATYTENDTYPEQSLYFLFDNQSDLSYLYFLGLLNSQFINFYYQVKSLTNRASIAQVKKMDLDKLPIRAIDFDDPEDVALHDRMVSLVEEMLELNKRLRETESPSTRKSLEAQIEHTDRKIDELVYELYGLTEKEIRIVESN